jgi:hypothetical protein
MWEILGRNEENKEIQLAKLGNAYGFWSDRMSKKIMWKKKLDLSMMPVCKVMVNKVGRAEIERIISLLELTISW